MADTRISDLSKLSGPLSTNDGIPIADNSAGQTKQVDPKHLVEQAVVLMDDGSIPAAKVGGLELADGSVDEAAIADKAVTAAKLADNSSGVVSDGPPSPGLRIGQLAIDSSNQKFYVWSGSQWLQAKAPGSINVIEGDVTAPVEIDAAQTGDTVKLTAYLSPTTAPRQFLGGPTAGNGDVTARQIVGDDLPNASTTQKGAVSVPGNGLSVTDGALAIDNAITPNDSSTLHLVEYNAQGLVVFGRPIQGTDLPYAQPGIGGVIKPGTGLFVDEDGRLNHSNNVSAATASKVQWDTEGHVLGGLPLTQEDLPNLSADQVTEGEFPSSRLAENSVHVKQLADYSICLMQESNPGDNDPVTGEPHFLGRFWYQPSSAQLRVYARSSDSLLWMNVGFGNLSQQNLRFLGTANAETGRVVTLTAEGTSLGYKANDQLKAADEEQSGGYFLIEVGGAGFTVDEIQGVDFTVGDWALALAQKWIHIDTNSGSGGGGGGGGVEYLNDLLDVSLGDGSLDSREVYDMDVTPAPRALLSDGQYLRYDGESGLWKNRTVSTSDIRDLSPGTQNGQILVWDGSAWNPQAPDAIPTVNDGAINITGEEGITATGENATANQSGSTTRTLSINTTWLDDYINTNHPQVTPGDGQINVSGGDGITATGNNAKANQSTNTTRTLAIDTTWLSAFLDTNKPTYWSESGGNLYPTTLTNNVQVGGTAADPNISLNANGSADVARLVVDGSIATIGNYYSLVKNGSGTIIGGWTNTDDSFKIGGTLPDTPNISLNASGSATFAGPVDIKRPDNSNSEALAVYDGTTKSVRIKSFGDVQLGGVNVGTAPNISLYGSDGSAEFAGNVGIGTDAPASKLDVRSNKQYDGIKLNQLNGTKVVELAGLTSDNDDGSLALYDGGVKRVFFSAGTGRNYIGNGNVGIGTTSPAQQLHVQPAADNGGILVSNTKSNRFISCTASDEDTGYRFGYSKTAGGLIQRCDGDGNYISNTMVFTDSNDVGIGTDSPAEKLHVNGKIRANDYDLEALPPLP